MRKGVYVVESSGDERGELYTLIRGGTARARLLNRAHILLHADDGEGDAEIAAALHTSMSTARRIRERICESGVHAGLHEVTRPGGEREPGGAQEAYAVALARSTPPEGHCEWTMQLLTDQVVALGMVGGISDETIRRTLKRGPSSRGNTGSGASPR